MEWRLCMGKKIFTVFFILFQGAFFTFILMMGIYDAKISPVIQEKNRKIAEMKYILDLYNGRHYHKTESEIKRFDLANTERPSDKYWVIEL